MSAGRPTVVQFGAGAIGRGFLGQLWTGGGYEVVFVDVDSDLVAALDASGSYPLRLIGTESEETVTVSPVRALRADDVEAVRTAVADCAFAATAVGIDHLAEVGLRLLGPGVAARFAAGKGPLNILCCENGATAPAQLAAALRAVVPDAAFSIAPTVVGRMVPPPVGATGQRPEAPLLVAAEPYERLPFLATGWRGPLPDVPGLEPVRSAAAWKLEERRKLFTHNGGHAVLAYLGARAGHEFIWQAAEDPKIAAALTGFWAEVDAALAAAQPGEYDGAYQQRHEEDLLHRFRNRALGDTIARVGRDPARKLRSDDRLVGAALLCLEYGVRPVHAARAVAAALRFDGAAGGDPSAASVQTALAAGGVAGALKCLAGLPADHPLTRLVADEATAGCD